MALVRRMLELGVDPNAVDSYGNNALLRALMDSRQRLVLDPGFLTMSKMSRSTAISVRYLKP